MLRLAGPADVPAITRLYQDLSPESFARRFHGGRLAPSMLARLASFRAGTVWPLTGGAGRTGLLGDEPSIRMTCPWRLEGFPGPKGSFRL